ncbi:MAG: ATP-binding protein [Candidatus Ozemobacteraceae bacterium]
MVIQGILDAISVEHGEPGISEASPELFDYAPVGIFHSTLAGHFLRVNPSLALLLGHDSPEQLLREAPDIATHVCANPEQRKHILTRALAAKGFIRFENEYRRHDGVVYAIVMLRAVRDAAGTASHLEGFILDITERRKLETELRTAREQAEKAVRTRTSFLASMSHEIRAPMNGVLGMTELLLETSLTKDQKELLSAVHSSADLLLSIVNEILDFSKIEAGKMSLETIPFQVEMLLEETLGLLKIKAVEKGLQCAFEIDPEVPRILRGDPLRVKQILINMIGNALKFTSEGVVRISVTEESRDRAFSKVRFSVIDTGVGIPSKTLVRLFQPFYQGERPGGERIPGGTGLGLVISKRLVELMGGQIGVTSRFGKGSTFWFTVPFAFQDPAKTVQTGFFEVPQRFSPLEHRSYVSRGDSFLRRFKAMPSGKILVVEDNLVHQRLVELLLRKQELKYAMVTDGLRAMEALAREQFSLILMDIRMPGLNGFETTRRIREREKMMSEPGNRISIIAMTADALNEDRKKCLQAGMDDYIAKPISAENLYQLLERWLERSMAIKRQNEEAELRRKEEAFSEKIPGDGLDAAVLRQIRELQVNGDPNFMEHLIHVFLRDVPSKVEVLIGALREGQNQSVRLAAASMKLACRNLGAMDFARLLQEIETRASKGEVVAIDAAIASIRGEFARVRTSLAAILDHRFQIV